MTRFSDLLSAGAQELRRHSPPRPRVQPDQPSQPRLIRLDSNENPLGPSPLAIDAMRSALASVNLYPDDDSSELRRKLAAHYGVQEEQMLVTAGSAGLLSLLCQTLLGPGLNAVTSECSFVVYSQIVRATGAQLIETPMQNDTFDLAAILAAINPETRLVFLANPNNPTGTMLEAAEVDNFLARVPGHVIVALDEAYYEYAAHFAALRGVAYSRSLDYVRQGAAVVVLRTFSKVHGLAGLRVGYGFGPAELLSYCAQMRNTYSVASIAEAAALAAMNDQNHIDRTLHLNADQAQVLTKGLSGLGYRVVPTWANFLYCDVRKDARKDVREGVREDALGFATRLQNDGAVVRPLGPWGAAHCIRVSIGTEEQNQFLLDAVRKMNS
ncbi:MAG: histidinol-phosphate transaminase [Candidatus Sulfotelmatobacter sp.]